MNTNPNHSQETIDLVWRGFLAIMIALMAMYLPLDALAAGLLMGGDTTGTGSSLDQAFCNVISWFNGPIGKGIATVALIIVGVGALMGKVSWGMALIVGIGIAVVFGATTVVDMIGGAGSQTCTTGTYSGNTTTG